MAAKANGNSGTEEDVLRLNFVEMLFALAVGQVAINAADVVSITAALSAKAPALAHLGVGLILISASWVGWRQSKSPGMKDKVKYLFSLAFLGLLLDVILVIIYFIVVRHVEIDQINGVPSLTEPTAVPEALGLCVVFGVYAFWDLVADVLSPGCIPKWTYGEGKPRGWRLWKTVRAIIVSMIASLICLSLSYLVYSVAATRREISQVVLLDGALVVLILFFRVVKAIENPLSEWLRVKDCKAFQQPREIQKGTPYLGVVLAALYFACVIFAS